MRREPAALHDEAVGAGLAVPLAALGLERTEATTHHQSCDLLTQSHPSIRVVRERRFVEHEHVATAGGLSSGIDLALRVLERYLGRPAADATAEFMEYERSSLAVA